MAPKQCLYCFDALQEGEKYASPHSILGEFLTPITYHLLVASRRDVNVTMTNSDEKNYRLNFSALWDHTDRSLKVEFTYSINF